MTQLRRVQHFDPTRLILVGGLTTQEESLGFVQLRIKKHRWHKKILKNKVLSLLALLVQKYKW